MIDALPFVGILAAYLMFRRYMKYVERSEKNNKVLTDKYQWLLYGMDRDWVRSYCATHDYYHTSEEEDMFETLDDPCIPIYRLMDGPR